MGQATAKLIDLGASVIGGGLTAGGQIGEAFGASQQAAYQASILKYNATIANEAAAQALRAGDIAVQERQIETAQTIGTQRAALAGRGIMVDRGTADVIAADAKRIGKLDEIIIKENAERQAMAYRMQGYNFLAEAASRKAEGKQALIAGLVGAGSTFLTTAGNVAAKWKVFKNEQNSETLGE